MKTRWRDGESVLANPIRWTRAPQKPSRKGHFDVTPSGILTDLQQRYLGKKPSQGVPNF